MRLFLIRHAETVDNVAGLYAGSRDSALTAHGVLQTRRLATHLAEAIAVPKPVSASRARVFSSDLQRAVRTAEAIRDAAWPHPDRIEAQQLPELREKDFGSGEGKKFGGHGRDREPHEGAESADALRKRVELFLEGRLLPLLTGEGVDVVVVVSHGITLSLLYRVLCQHLAAESITASPEARHAAGSTGLMAAPSLANTGYIELVLAGRSTTWSSVKMHVLALNSVEHLKGLRKTRGGIGSARFDDKQKTLHSFFKSSSIKRKHSDAADHDSEVCLLIFFSDALPRAFVMKQQFTQTCSEPSMWKQLCPTAV
jgi:2,3-bisphosphoglycerate-dependent phosphoglycerate mutase